MASKTVKKEWSVIEYSDGIVAVCPSCEVNANDDRVETISEHSQFADAEKARDAYGKKNKKLTIQK